jgi:hypothetical protein
MFFGSSFAQIFRMCNGLLEFYELHFYPSPFLLQSSWHSIGGLCETNILILKMSSTCFEPEGSSSGSRLYGVSSLLVPLACKQIVPYLYVQPCSWRGTLWFETCRGHRKN